MENNPVQPPVQNVVPVTTPVNTPETEPKHKIPKWFKFLAPAVVIVLAIVLSAGAYLSLSSNKQVACTMEAKLCPDGSSVSRTGPKCEFAACPKTPTPTSNLTANWKTYTATNYYLKYPSDWFVNTSSDSTANGPIEISDLQNSPTAIIGASDTHTRIGISYSTGSMPTNFPLGNGESSQNPTIKPFSENGYTGIRGKSGSTAGTIDNVLLKDPNGGYIWIQLTPAQKDDATSEKIFEQILSTFKFTDQTSQSNETISPTPTPNPKTNNWNKYSDSKYNFSFKLPTDWTTQVKDYPENNQRLINIIKNSSPSVVSLSFTISNNWDNTGNAQYLPRNITVGGIQALRIDPPKPQEKQLERYQTNVYFENGGHVYFFACTHNWNQNYIDTCNNILSTVQFTQ